MVRQATEQLLADMGPTVWLCKTALIISCQTCMVRQAAAEHGDLTWALASIYALRYAAVRLARWAMLLHDCRAG